jgi:hypothetical protein
MYTKCVTSVMQAYKNTQFKSFQKWFGLFSRYCEGKVLKPFPHFECQRKQHVAQELQVERVSVQLAYDLFRSTWHIYQCNLKRRRIHQQHKISLRFIWLTQLAHIVNITISTITVTKHYNSTQPNVHTQSSDETSWKIFLQVYDLWLCIIIIIRIIIIIKWI